VDRHAGSPPRGLGIAAGGLLHAERGVALRMQDVVQCYSDELRRGQGVEVQIRVGVKSGDVVVRAIGSDLRMDYTAAVGQTTHLAARMEQLAAPSAAGDGDTRFTTNDQLASLARARPR